MALRLLNVHLKTTRLSRTSRWSSHHQSQCLSNRVANSCLKNHERSILVSNKCRGKSNQNHNWHHLLQKSHKESLSLNSASARAKSIRQCLTVKTIKTSNSIWILCSMHQRELPENHSKCLKARLELKLLKMLSHRQERQMLNYWGSRPKSTHRCAKKLKKTVISSKLTQ